MLSYTPLPVTAIVGFSYFVIFASVLLSDTLPEIPADTHNLDVEGAWEKLHVIASHPHPYNSHANDIVRGHILDWIKNTTQGFSHVETVNDLTSNGTWADYSLIEQAVHGVSFEGNNILVKVEGTDPAFASQGGVLFSAHFDSVSTAPGVTDNAMAIVTVLELIKLLTTTRTKRTAIFNINNGEEDGLKGAQTFMQHPWSSIPDTFLNLEGAGAGGHPTLFRATSKAPVLSFADPSVLHPHGTVLSADAFARKVVRSRTDYSVYELGQGDGSRGMEGLDFAYYQGRSKYHTKYDSIPGTKGGRKSLWSMMESTRAVGLALLNQDETHVGSSEQPVPAVYFDLFGRQFFVFTQKSFLFFNAALLVLAPAFVLFLHRLAAVATPDRRSNKQRVTKFWTVVFSGFILQTVLGWGFLKLNSFIVYSRPFIVVTSHLSLAYLSIVTPSHLSSAVDSEHAAAMGKSSMFLQSYIFTWLLHALGTYGLKKLELGGVYFLTAWNFFTFLGYVLASLENILQGRSSLPNLSRRSQPPSESSRVEDNAALTDEQTPLLSRSSPSGADIPAESAETKGLWMIQILLAIPGPAILLSENLLLLIHALHQTLSDGSSPIVVYGAIGLLSFFVVLPIAPFSGRIHGWLTSVVFLVFVVSTVYSWAVFPFSKEEPLKVFFQQRIEVDLSSSTSSNKVVKSTTSLTGASQFIGELIIPALPSSWSSDVHCATAILPALSTCSWESPLLPYPVNPQDDSSQPPHWLSVKATKTSPTSAFFSVNGTNTRSCRIYFDNRPIKSFKVHEVLPDGTTVIPGDNMRKAFPIPAGGVNIVTLWSRTWDRTFDVEVYWDAPSSANGISVNDAKDEPDASSLSGRIACEWAEYESGTLGFKGLQADPTGAIPAYEETLMYLPEWAVATKIGDGLAEVFTRFDLS